MSKLADSPDRVLPTVAPGPTGVRPREEAPARRTLLGQVARLELELEELRWSAWPRRELSLAGPGCVGAQPCADPSPCLPKAGGGPCADPPAAIPRAPGARLQSLAELEELRDRLVLATGRGREALAARTQKEERSRRLAEEMLLDPGRHAGLRISNADLGESGCTVREARPVAGLLGMFLGWWRVVISSGCP